MVISYGYTWDIHPLLHVHTKTSNNPHTGVSFDFACYINVELTHITLQLAFFI